MKIKIIEVSSGFANIPNQFVFAEDYYKSAVSRRTDSGYDKAFEVELPNDCSVAETVYRETCILDNQGNVLTHIEKYSDKVCITDYSVRIWAKIV